MSVPTSSSVTPAGGGTLFDPTKAKGEYNQYWYSTNTIAAIVAEVTHHATAGAFLSTPSLFFALDHRRGDEDHETDVRLRKLRAASRVFEYDAQWATDPCYVQYDFHKPEQVPVQYIGHFDYIVADPPFITGDVWTHYVATVKLLLKEGGKLLLTTVLENHTMLENLLDRPLFIASFYPVVEHLTYQYVCFLSYEPTVLEQQNPEVPALDAKITAAIRMANDLRSSEKEFALQMATRKREGEERLPTAAYERELMLAKNPDAAAAAAVEEKLLDWDTLPIERMEWGYIPEGLTMYPQGQSGPTPNNAMAPSSSSHFNAAAATDTASDAYGPLYAACVRLRTDLDAFKGGVDALQRHMDAQMKLRRQRVKVNRELHTAQEEMKDAAAAAGGAEMVADLEAQLAQLSSDIDTNETERAAKLTAMTQLAEVIMAGEAAVAALSTNESARPASIDARADTDRTAAMEETEVQRVRPPSAVRVQYAQAMADCIAAYRTVEAKKVALQEVAAEATGRYKFPIFARMKELLQQMKELKQKWTSVAVGGTAVPVA